LLLDSLPILLLLFPELILLLLLLPVQLGIRGRLNDRPRRSRNLVRVGCRRGNRSVDLRRLRYRVRVHRAFPRPVSRTIGGLRSFRRYRFVRC
jgi:hypothetical protein